eukprot:2258971-Alexandrium_andersonii.AAC.1
MQPERGRQGAARTGPRTGAPLGQPRGADQQEAAHNQQEAAYNVTGRWLRGLAQGKSVETTASRSAL